MLLKICSILVIKTLKSKISDFLNRNMCFCSGLYSPVLHISIMVCQNGVRTYVPWSKPVLEDVCPPSDWEKGWIKVKLSSKAKRGQIAMGTVEFCPRLALNENCSTGHDLLELESGHKSLYGVTTCFTQKNTLHDKNVWRVYWTFHETTQRSHISCWRGPQHSTVEFL